MATLPLAWEAQACTRGEVRENYVVELAKALVVLLSTIYNG